MSEIVLKETLKEHRLRNTQCRTDILAIFYEHDFALSHADIEDRVSEHYDRVTVYRTLKTFVDKGLIHMELKNMLCAIPTAPKTCISMSMFTLNASGVGSQLVSTNQTFQE